MNRSTMFKGLFIFGLILMACTQIPGAEGTMDADFCPALIANDRPTLQKLIDPQLDAAHSLDNLEEKLAGFKIWLESHVCVTSVQMRAQLLDTFPPVQEFIISIRTDDGLSEVRSIGVRTAQDRLRFDIR